MVVEKYCQITARDSAVIPIFWKVSHIGSLVVAAVCSLIAVWNQNLVVEAFGRRCILFAKLNFSEDYYEPVGKPETNTSFNNHLTLWGSAQYCSFTKACYIFSMVIAMILGAFIIILPKGGKSLKSVLYTDVWKIIPFFLLISAIMTIFIIVAHMIIQNGMDLFTKQIYNNLLADGLCEEDNCKEKLNIYTACFHPKEIKISSNIKLLLQSSMAVLSAWAVLTGTLTSRVILGVDFRIVLYQLTTTTRHMSTPNSVSSSSIISQTATEKLKPMPKRSSMDTRQSADEDLDDSEEENETLV